MRKKSEIELRIKQKRLNILTGLIKDKTQAHPSNCIHGSVNKDDPNQHFCMFGALDQETWPGDFCDEDVASSCPYFALAFPLSDIEDDCKSYLTSIMEDPNLMQSLYPDLFELYWSLGLEEEFPYYADDFKWYERFNLKLKRYKNFINSFL